MAFFLSIRHQYNSGLYMLMLCMSKYVVGYHRTNYGLSTSLFRHTSEIPGLGYLDPINRLAHTSSCLNIFQKHGGYSDYDLRLLGSSRCFDPSQYIQASRQGWSYSAHTCVGQIVPGEPVALDIEFQTYKHKDWVKWRHRWGVSQSWTVRVKQYSMYTQPTRG